jgi:hypothetical protein
MRLNEFVYDEDIVEDEAEARGDIDLITTLEFLRNQSAGKHLVPRVRVDSLINMINMHNGNETFSNPSLMNAFKSNEVVKNLIADIKDDESTGIKYVYLQPTESDDPDQIDGSAEGANVVKTEPEKVVSSMANKAIANRS